MTIPTPGKMLSARPRKPCDVEGCEDKAVWLVERSRHLCHMHYEWYVEDHVKSVSQT